MRAFGEVMEPCPLTGRWSTVRVDDLHWIASPPTASTQPARSPELSDILLTPRTIEGVQTPS